MNIQTSRHKLPFLAVGQAQKEFTHNEALLMIDTIMNLSVRAVSNDPAAAGQISRAIDESDNEENIPQSWLIGDAPTDIWENHPKQIAIWSSNGWRYIRPFEGMQIYHHDDRYQIIYTDNQWKVAPSMDKALLTDGDDGANIDHQARDTIRLILAILEQFGLIR